MTKSSEPKVDILTRSKQFIYQTRDWIGYTFTPDPYTTHMNGTSVSYRVTTVTEYRRAKQLAGENQQVKHFFNQLHQDDVVWDIGACVGTYSCLAAQKAREVVAYEPHPQNASRLAENVELNDLDDQVTIRNHGLGAKNTVADLAIEGDSVGGGRHSFRDEVSDESLSTSISKGDDLVADGASHPTVLKVDVEGFEDAVLEGLESVLSNDECRLAYIECHPHRGGTVKGVEKLLRKAGFQTERRWSEGHHTFVFGRK